MLSSEDIAELTGLIYGSIFEEQQWVPLMNRMADVVGGGATALICKNLVTGQGRGLFGRIHAEEFSDYFGRFAQTNPLATAINPLPAGAFLIDWQVMQKPRLMRSEYYNDFLLRRGIHGVLGLMIWREGNDAAIINLTRPPGTGEFLPEHVDALAPLMPHLRHAIGLSRKLPPWRGEPEAFETAFALFDTGILVLDRDGLILYANHEAERILSTRDGFRVAHGALAAEEPAAGRRLTTLIEKAARSAVPTGGSMAVPRSSGRRPFVLEVTPCKPERVSLFPPPARVLLSISDLEIQWEPSGALLRTLFGLTQAQASVAVLFARGYQSTEIAAALEISLYTVRRHLGDIMMKTDTRSQVALMQLLARIRPSNTREEAASVKDAADPSPGNWRLKSNGQSISWS